jgi:hypothetical protein
MRTCGVYSYRKLNKMLRDNMRTLSHSPAFDKVCEATVRPAHILRKRPSLAKNDHVIEQLFNHLYVEQIYIM